MKNPFWASVSHTVRAPAVALSCCRAQSIRGEWTLKKWDDSVKLPSVWCQLCTQEDVTLKMYHSWNNTLTPQSAWCSTVIAVTVQSPFHQPSSTVAMRGCQCGSDGVLENLLNHPRNPFLECVWSVIFACLLTMVIVKRPIHSTKQSWHCYLYSWALNLIFDLCYKVTRLFGPCTEVDFLTSFTLFFFFFFTVRYLFL